MVRGPHESVDTSDPTMQRSDDGEALPLGVEPDISRAEADARDRRLQHSVLSGGRGIPAVQAAMQCLMGKERSHKAVPLFILCYT